MEDDTIFFAKKDDLNFFCRFKTAELFIVKQAKAELCQARAQVDFPVNAR
jgi:hypothetical protein